MGKLIFFMKMKEKGCSAEELREVIRWLTGFNQTVLESHLSQKRNLTEFFGAAKLNPNTELITGTIWVVKIQEISVLLMKKIRRRDKLVDELAKGRHMENILRK